MILLILIFLFVKHFFDLVHVSLRFVEVRINTLIRQWTTNASILLQISLIIKIISIIAQLQLIIMWLLLILIWNSLSDYSRVYDAGAWTAVLSLLHRATILTTRNSTKGSSLLAQMVTEC